MKRYWQHKARLRFIAKNGMRYFLMSRFHLIDGFLMDDEAIALHEASKSIVKKNPTIVEIGSWQGKSSIVIASGLKKNQGKLYCVDPFNGAGDARSAVRYSKDAAALGRSLIEQFQKNISDAGLSDLVEAMPGFSSEVRKKWNETKHIDFIFIDGDHSYEAVKKDFLDWSPIVNVGGYVAFHDTYLNVPKDKSDRLHTGPGLVVKEFLLENSKWKLVSRANSLFIFQKNHE